MKKQGSNAMGKCSVKLWYNKQRIMQSGNVSLYIQIILKGSTVKFPLKIEWPVKFINLKKRELMPRYGNDPDFIAFQAIVQKEISKYWSAVTKFLLQGIDFKMTDIISEVQADQVSRNLAQYIRARAKKRYREKDIKERTYNAHRATADCIDTYQKKGVDIGKINSEWLEKYHRWLMMRMGEGGAWCRIKDVKAYLTIAHKKDKVIVDRDYENYSNSKPESDPVWLEPEELVKLMQFYIDPQTSTEDRGPVKAFLYACFTGLRISDLRRWNLSWIEGNEMIFQPVKQRITDKRKHIIRIPLIPITKTFIDNLSGSTFDLPSDQKYNKRLKRIAKNVGIYKNLTTHVARHTFGTQLALAGVPLFVISKLMGHRKPETTMVYIHIAEQAKASAMMKLQDIFGNYGFPEAKLLTIPEPSITH